jgi:hypothetical protein
MVIVDKINETSIQTQRRAHQNVNIYL